MKTIFRIAAIAILAFGAAVTSVFAQDAPCTPEMQAKLFNEFKEKVKSQDPATIRAGVKAGEEFLAKCAEGQDKVAAFIREKSPGHLKRADEIEFLGPFNAATKDRKTANPDLAFQAGRVAIPKYPEYAFDIAISLVVIGFENSVKTPPVDKFNNDTIMYAKQVIRDIENGKTSENWGGGGWLSIVVVDPATKKPDPVKSKQKVLASMNYTIGSILYYNQKNEKDALPFFYKASQIDSEVNKRPDLYAAIGGWYRKEIVRLDRERLDKIKLAGDKDTDETLAILAMEKGLAERGMNAYGKALKLSDPVKQADYVKFLKETLSGLYEVRFGKQDGFDVYVNTVAAQPLVDPMSPVTPVVEAPTTMIVPVTTPATTPTTTPTNSTTKPVSAPTNTKPTTTPVSAPTNTKPTSTTKPAAKTKAAVNKKR